MIQQKYIDIHSHNSTSNKDILRVKNIFPSQANNDKSNEDSQHFSIGIHPWRINERDVKGDIETIKEYASSDYCLAIGEIGLDRLTDVPLDKQFDLFIKQLEIAEGLKKPVIIHCVKAYPELITIKKNRTISIPWIIHGFNNNTQLATDLLKHDCYLSFGYHLTIDNSNAQKVLKIISEENFFLETDDKDHSIENIYNIAAKIKNIEPEKVIKIIHENYKRVFNTT